MYFQPHADIYSSLPMAFIAAKQASLCTEENNWHGSSAAYSHTQLTCAVGYILFPQVIDLKQGAIKDVLQRHFQF